jgi:hypothetical protein
VDDCTGTQQFPHRKLQEQQHTVGSYEQKLRSFSSFLKSWCCLKRESRLAQGNTVGIVASRLLNSSSIHFVHENSKKFAAVVLFPHPNNSHSIRCFSSTLTSEGNHDEKQSCHDDHHDNTSRPPAPQQISPSAVSTEWIPPPPRIYEDDDTETTTVDKYPYNDSVSQQQQRLYKQQERIDTMYQQQENALLQLTEEEMDTLSDDDILKRVEQVLAMEEALEEASFWQELQREEEQAQTNQQQQPTTPNTDWLQTRRAALGINVNDSEQASSLILPVIPHKLFTAEEIQTILESQGGSNVTVLMDDPEYPRMGGAHGMIFCTAGSNNSTNDANEVVTTVNPFVINTLTRTLITHLKDRKLDEVGVSGAQMGTNHLSPRGTAHTPRSMQSTWHVVDCGSYIVHIMDVHTRNHLKLEDLWSGKDPLWQLEYWKDDAVEEYCEKHPVPRFYNGGNSAPVATDPFGSYWDPAMVRRLERNQYTSLSSPFPRHRPVISNATKRRDRREGKRKRREVQQQQRRQHSQRQ